MPESRVWEGWGWGAGAFDTAPSSALWACCNSSLLGGLAFIPCGGRQQPYTLPASKCGGQGRKEAISVGVTGCGACLGLGQKQERDRRRR